MRALAEAGYHAVAPDQHGSGQTDRPEPIEACHILQLTGDRRDLVHALGAQRAIMVGHDSGAPVAWHGTLLRPDMFDAVVWLSVPYRQRSWKDIRPTKAMPRLAGAQEFYQMYFQEAGTAEADLEADVRMTMRGLLYAASGDSPLEKRWRFLFGKSEMCLNTGSLPDTLPVGLTEQDRDVLTREFERTGFRGGFNWYRNSDRLWELTPCLSGATRRQPALLIAGACDPVITMDREVFEAMDQTVPRLRKKVLLPGAGHWIQQERPAQVN